MISLGSCFWPKNYEHCAIMKLKRGGECVQEDFKSELKMI